MDSSRCQWSRSNTLAFLTGVALATSLIFAVSNSKQQQQILRNNIATIEGSNHNHRQLATTSLDCYSDPKSVSLRTRNAVEGWVRPDKIFGLIHMTKTAGTEINGELASHFERVCGNKGWSYDYYQHNERIKEFAALETNWKNSKFKHGKVVIKATAANNFNDAITSQFSHIGEYNRGITPKEIMDEIGIEDCDYIAQEADSKYWQHIAEANQKLELHVPCRDSLDHLMSQCNGQDTPKRFDCSDPNVERQIDECAINIDPGFRFRDNLASNPNIELKCFDPMNSPAKYRDYMGTLLQRKRVEADYFHRETNEYRHPDFECIWSAGGEYQFRTRQVLRRKFEYYQFCHECMGSENELPLANF